MNGSVTGHVMSHMVNAEMHTSFSHVGNVQKHALLQIEITPGPCLRLCVSPLVLSSLLLISSCLLFSVGF